MSKLRKAVTKERIKQLGQDVEPAQSVPVVPLRRRRARAAGDVGSHTSANGNADTQPPTEEPESIREARERLRALIAEATKDAPRPSVGIVLAIVNQETGNHAAANALIEEYGLERLFGIKKFCPNA